MMKRHPVAILLEVGYVENSKQLTSWLTRHLGATSYIIRFRPTFTTDCPRLSVEQLFGVRDLAYVILDNETAKKRFSRFLHYKFLQAHPKPSSYERMQFTRVLHEYNLPSVFSGEMTVQYKRA